MSPLDRFQRGDIPGNPPLGSMPLSLLPIASKGTLVRMFCSLVHSPKNVGIQAVPSREMLSGGDIMNVKAVESRSLLAMAKRRFTVSVTPEAIRVVPPWLNRAMGLPVDAVAWNESTTTALGPGFRISRPMAMTIESPPCEIILVDAGENAHCRRASRSAREAQPDKTIGATTTKASRMGFMSRQVRESWCSRQEIRGAGNCMIMDRPTRKIPGNEAMEGAAAMSTVGQIVRKNANGLLTTHPKESVFAALEIMAKHDIGALVVMDGGMLAGLFTERDYARKVILKGRSSRECSVGELMGDAVRVGPDCLVADALALMASRDRRTRYLVVGDGSALEGVVSIGDLVKAQMSQQQATIEALEHYITSPG